MSHRRLGLALVLAPSIGACSLERVAGDAEGWTEVRTEHVTLRTDVSRRRAIEAAARMERTYSAFAQSWIACAEGDELPPVEVTLLASARTADAILGRAVAGFHGDDSWWAASVDRIVMRADRAERGEALFQHELVHSLIAHCLPGAPRWLDEGFAEFLETAKVGDGTITVGIPTTLFTESTIPDSLEVAGTTIATIPRRWFVPLSVLREVDAQHFYGDLDRRDVDARAEVQGRYGSAALAVRRFESDAGVFHEAFTRYLAAVRRGDADAWEAHLGELDVDAFVARGLDRGTIRILDLDYESVEASPPIARSMSEADAHLELGLVWSFGSRASAGEHLRRHAEAALLDPGARARARWLLAHDALEREDLRGAARLLDEGLAADPGDRALRTAHLMQRLESRTLARPEDVRDETFALDADALDAPSLVAVARGLLVLGDPAAALVRTERAVALDPSSVEVWVTHAVALADLGRHDEALIGIDRAIARVGHGTEAIASLVDLRDRIAAGRSR